jgi:hypothetical protein
LGIGVIRERSKLGVHLTMPKVQSGPWVNKRGIPSGFDLVRASKEVTQMQKRDLLARTFANS